MNEKKGKEEHKNVSKGTKEIKEEMLERMKGSPSALNFNKKLVRMHW